MLRVSSCREFFETVGERFRPDKAEGINATLLYDLQGDGGGVWTVAVEEGTVSAWDGGVADPNLTIVMTATDFVQMVNGDLNPMQLFMTGRMRADNMTLGTHMIHFLSLG